MSPWAQLNPMTSFRDIGGQSWINGYLGNFVLISISCIFKKTDQLILNLFMGEFSHKNGILKNILIVYTGFTKKSVELLYF